MTAILEKAGAEKGDVVLIVGDTDDSVVLPTLGALRVEVAKRLDIIKDGYNFLWVVEFPFFEFDKESGEWVAMHHPFTSPTDECLDKLEGDKGNVYAKAYDMVLNGIELSSGSIRITNPALQKRMFEMLGLSDEEAQKKFGFLTGAFKYGAPPHGGIAPGLDRLIMLMCHEESIHEVIAFPKNNLAASPMDECPSPVDEQQLKDLHITCYDVEKD